MRKMECWWKKVNKRGKEARMVCGLGADGASGEETGEAERVT